MTLKADQKFGSINFAFHLVTELTLVIMTAITKNGLIQLKFRFKSVIKLK